MTGSVSLRLVVVLYRSRLRRLRPLVEQLRRLSLPVEAVVITAVLNRDDHHARARLAHRLKLEGIGTMDIVLHANAHGVAGAYNWAIRAAQGNEILVLLDSDSTPSDDYLKTIVEESRTAHSGLHFTCPELFAGGMRISPYRLQRTVPVPVEGPLPSHDICFADGYGVVNACLSGAADAFRAVNGFDERIGLDLSDVAWSLEAARKDARLRVVGAPQVHDLSMMSGQFGLRRLRRYLGACVRVWRRYGDLPGFVRLALRGMRAATMRGRSS